MHWKKYLSNACKLAVSSDKLQRLHLIPHPLLLLVAWPGRQMLLQHRKKVNLFGPEAELCVGQACLENGWLRKLQRRVRKQLIVPE